MPTTSSTLVDPSLTRFVFFFKNSWHFAVIYIKIDYQTSIIVIACIIANIKIFKMNYCSIKIKILRHMYNLQFLTTSSRRCLAEILPIRRKTLHNQSINHYVYFYSGRKPYDSNKIHPWKGRNLHSYNIWWARNLSLKTRPSLQLSICLSVLQKRYVYIGTMSLHVIFS